MFYKYFEGIFFKLNSGQRESLGFAIPNNSTKTCIVAGALFTAQSAGLLDVPADLLMQILVALAVTLRLSNLFLAAEPDPYLAFESVACNVIFGQAGTPPTETRTPATEINNETDDKPDKKVSTASTESFS